MPKQVSAGSGITGDFGIVTGGDAVTVQLRSTFQQITEFKVTVAIYTGVGGTAAFVAADKGLQNFAAKFTAIIKYMKEFTLIPFRERKWKERGYI